MPCASVLRSDEAIPLIPRLVVLSDVVVPFVKRKFVPESAVVDAFVIVP